MLTTNRLILRPASTAFGQVLWPIVKRNREGIKLTYWLESTNKAQLIKNLAFYAREHSKNRARHWIVCEKTSDRPVGAIDLYAIRRTDLGRTAFTSVWLDRDFRGQGYAQEAFGAVIEEARKSLGVNAIEATVLASNTKSRALLTRLGLCNQIPKPYNPRELICKMRTGLDDQMTQSA